MDFSSEFSTEGKYLQCFTFTISVSPHLGPAGCASTEHLNSGNICHGRRFIVGTHSLAPYLDFVLLDSSVSCPKTCEFS